MKKQTERLTETLRERERQSARTDKQKERKRQIGRKLCDNQVAKEKQTDREKEKKSQRDRVTDTHTHTNKDIGRVMSLDEKISPAWHFLGPQWKIRDQNTQNTKYFQSQGKHWRKRDKQTEKKDRIRKPE